MKSTKSKKKDSNRNLYLILIICIIVIIIGIIIGRRQTEPHQDLTDPNTPVPITVVSNVYQSAEPLANAEDKLAETATGTIWWITDDNYNILIKNADSVSYSAPVNPNTEVPQDVIAYILQQPGMKEFYTLSLAELEADGFIKNEKNSSKSFTDTQFYDYVQAYEKGNTKCTVTVSPDATGTEQNPETLFYTTTLACSNDFQKYYDEQAPFLKALAVHDAVVWDIEKQEGPFYWLNINYRRTGHYTIVKKEGNTYTEVYSGQDQAPCDVMDEFEVPQSFYGSCFDTTTNEIRE